jgi:hypothetical protein
LDPISHHYGAGRGVEQPPFLLDTSSRGEILYYGLIRGICREAAHASIEGLFLQLRMEMPPVVGFE